MEVKEKSISLVAVGEFQSDRDESELKLEQIHHEEITQKTFPGPKYTEWLQWFHNKMMPITYFEIGVESGSSLQYARYPTRSIGVDPAPRIVHAINSWAKIFKMTSDTFFTETDPFIEFNGRKIQLSFIDGLHEYEQVLKDFMNVEYHSLKNTIILLHDVHPAVPVTANRVRTTTYWAGDTWKVMQILKKHRPDLNIYTIPTYPTSMGVITNLDPDNMFIRKNLDKITAEVRDLNFEDYKDDPVGPVKNDFLTVEKILGL